MLEEWADAIRESVEERNRLRAELDAAQRALNTTDTKYMAVVKENEKLHEDKKLLQKMVIDTARNNANAVAMINDLRRDLEHTQTLYREATEQVYGMRLRIRFLEDIAHKTGHIIQLNAGGTK